MKFFRPKYRIIQRGNKRFYPQRLEFFLWYTDIPGCGSYMNQYQAFRDVEMMQEEDRRIKNYKTITQVIKV